MEKISQTANTASTKGEDDASVLPEKITVDFTTNELEGFWKGLVGYINDTAVTVDKVLIIKALAASMKMSKRFTKLEETITVSEDETPLDE
jgi:predicted secreted protein